MVGGCVFAVAGLWQEWTCGPPAQPFSIADAHLAMQLHREHDCARKRAAFAALVAAGRITPDSTRRHYLRENLDV
ncbi:hypothetical protein [Nocardia barduliensis]|uniref:hypothetical protein n=1 Tax=Nocardia barduliensis TaxID=2736643 RepID=UPI0015729DD3|nr:hypothetical protein [Nocardia barduliensis]